MGCGRRGPFQIPAERDQQHISGLSRHALIPILSNLIHSLIWALIKSVTCTDRKELSGPLLGEEVAFVDKMTAEKFQSETICQAPSFRECYLNNSWQ